MRRTRKVSGRVKMKRKLRACVTTAGLLIALLAADAAFAQKPDGVLKMYSPDSPASMSIHEEATVFADGPMMGVFNNLVIYDQHVPQSSLQSIVPDLATDLVMERRRDRIDIAAARRPRGMTAGPSRPRMSSALLTC